MSDDHAPRVHVRPGTNDHTLCGERGESISLAFLVEHVTPNLRGCCKGIWQRLCPVCDHLVLLQRIKR